MAVIEEFDDIKQQEKWAQGFKGGDMFEKPIEHPMMNFAEGEGQDMVKQAVGYTEAVTQPIEDVWINRRANSTTK